MRSSRSHPAGGVCLAALSAFAAFAAALCLAWLSGCSDQLAPATRIDKLRVLAVRAEPPEIFPGAATTLDALVALPVYQVAPAPLAFLWLGCRQPAGAQLPAACGVTTIGNGGPDAFVGTADGGAPANIPDCAADPAAALCQLGTTPEVTWTPLGDAQVDATQLIVTLIVADGGVDSALECARAASQGTGAPPDPDHCTIAIKRVSVSRSGSPNRNPRLSRFTFGDFSLSEGAAAFERTSAGAQPLTLPLVVARCTSGEIGRRAECPVGSQAQQKDDQSWEVLFVSWFATAGTPQLPRTSFMKDGCQGECLESGPEARTGWTAPDEAELRERVASGVVHLWAVVRDDRGGVGWLDGAASAK